MNRSDLPLPPQLRSHLVAGAPVSFLAALLVVIVATASPATGTNYDKIFVANEVPAAAKIYGGQFVKTFVAKAGMAQVTRQFSPLGAATVKVTFKGPPMETSSDKTNLGAQEQILDTNQTAANGWTAAEITTTDAPAHDKPNSAKHKIVVDARKAGPDGPYKLTQGGMVTFMNYVRTRMTGDAAGGLPNPTNGDKDADHSGEGAGAVQIKGVRVFVRAPGEVLRIKLLAKSHFTGNVLQTTNGGKVATKDPFFLTVMDVTSTLPVEVATEVVMELNAEATDGAYTVDETGIRLVVNRLNPQSMASIQFSQPSSWVINPYSYSATLLADGTLTASGLTPSSGWTVTPVGDTFEAFFSYGVDGQPYDLAEVEPSEGIFTEGNSYSYDPGTASGMYQSAPVTEQKVAGKKLLMRDAADPAKPDKLVYLTKDPGLALGEGGSQDDPTINGAALIVANPTTLESATYDLPATDGGAEFWTKNKAGTVYKYKNRLAPEGPSDVKIAKLKNGFIKVVAKGLQGFSLDEPSQGSIATTIAVGSIRYCSLFETVKKDVGISGTKAGTFKSKDQPAPAQCDDGSPSGAFLDGCRPL